MQLVAIVIPIYKERPTDIENSSFLQCLKIFKKRPIRLICPNSLNVEYYEKLLSKNSDISWKIERFSEKYFTSIEGYNKLLLSKSFYKRFKEFQFIQIYQLDAWVFRDDLDYWCSQNYDFIGAPWFEEYKQGNLNFTTVGNGGFSLRKVKSALKILSSHKRIESLKVIFKKEWEIPYNFNGRIGSFIKLIKIFCFLKNNTHHWFNDFNKNEDLFWSTIANELFKWYRIPDPGKALQYSFELNPSFLFEKNNYKLPFGCHAWEKYEPEFWKQHINIQF